MNLMQLNKALA